MRCLGCVHTGPPTRRGASDASRVNAAVDLVVGDNETCGQQTAGALSACYLEEHVTYQPDWAARDFSQLAYNTMIIQVETHLGLAR